MSPMEPILAADPVDATALRLGERWREEERANSITHGLGLILALVGSVALLRTALRNHDPQAWVGCAVYAVALVAVYAASFLSHLVHEPRRKRLFRILDQGFIYLLIAGTYTPLAVVYLRGGWWWLLMAMMWGVGLVGCCLKLLFVHRIEAVSTAACVLMGWMPIMAIKPMLALVPTGALWWMLAGGLCYTVGTLFLTRDGKVPYFHAVWHLWVIAGSACHFAAIFLYAAMPMAG